MSLPPLLVPSRGNHRKRTMSTEPAATAEQPNMQLPPEVLANLMKPRFIMKSAQYVDQDGRQITEMTCINGTPGPEVPRFIAHGQAHIKVKVPNPTGGPAQERVQAIPLNVVMQEVKDLDHAFSIYDATIESAGRAHVEQMKSQHLKAQLAAPSIIAPR